MQEEGEDVPSRARRARDGRDRDFRPVSPLRRMAQEVEEPPVARPLPFPGPKRSRLPWVAGGGLVLLALIAILEARRAHRAEALLHEAGAKASGPAPAADERSYPDILMARDLRIALLASIPDAAAPAPKKGRKAAKPAPRPAPAQSAFPGEAKVFWDPGTHAGVLRVAGLPAAPAGQEYVLWIKMEGKADDYVAAGNFPMPAEPGAVSLHRFRSGSERRVTGFELSLERADATVASVAPGSAGHPRGRSVLRSNALL